MGKFDLNTDTCGRGNFLIQKEKVADSKISGYVLTGPHYFSFLRGRGDLSHVALATVIFSRVKLMFRAKLTWYLIDGYIIKLIITFESLHLTLFRK